MVARIMRGIQVNAESIMLDLLEKVGSEGHFITEPRSAALCRAEAWVPTVLERNPYAQWEKKGSKQTDQLVVEKLQKILNNHHPVPLSADATQNIKGILARAEEREQTH